MTRKRLLALALVVLAGIAAGVALAQSQGRMSGQRRGPGMFTDDRRGIPDWKVDEHFKKDVFTFVRIEYTSGARGFGGGGFGEFGGRGGGGRRGRMGGYRGGGWGWATDYPDSDLNFSFRLQQLTSLKVNPEPITMRLTDPQLFDYPFIYIIEPGALIFDDDEVLALRKYLLNGGFLMVDDFWGEWAWQRFYHEIKRVFPNREPVELEITHPIFRCVYPLKEKPQVPSKDHALWGREEGITWEDHGPNSRDVHFWAIYDDAGRMMTIICHNTDLGDGWEREAEDEWYFQEFSAKKSYPMGINIVTYAMTH